MKDRRINAVVIGFGHAGEKIHAPLLRHCQTMHLRGISSSDSDKRRRIESELGCRAYESLEQVLDDEAVELVVLATPNELHAAQALAAMRAGKHVVIDKPMCLTTAEAREMIDCAQRTRKALTVFHNRRWDGDYLTLCDLLSRGELGKLHWLELSWQKSSPPRSWRQQAARGGGRLIDLGSHLIDQALQFMPSPVKMVYCRKQHDYAEMDVESHAMVTIGFEDGRTAVIDTTAMCFAPKPRFLALGSRGTFTKFGTDPQEAAVARGSLEIVHEDPGAWGTLASAEGQRRIQTIPGSWLSYYQQLGDALARWPEVELPVTAESAARVIAVLEAAAESAATGRAVVLNV